MKELNCRLIVSDFDGTLANSENEVTQKVIDAINGYVGCGGIFALCTGRILPSILPRARLIGLKGLAVACQGCVIADIESGKIIRSVGFKSGQTAEICAALEQLGSNVQVYHNAGFYSSLPAGEKHLELYESIIGIEAEHVEKKLSEFVIDSRTEFNKVAALCRPEEQEELFNALVEKFGDKYDVTCSAKVLVEISPYGETKGEALKFLAAHYGVPIEKTCAVGDNLNDASMVTAAGYGVAVGNAAKGLKEIARYITATNDEDAVAKVIEEYGYLK